MFLKSREAVRSSFERRATQTYGPRDSRTLTDPRTVCLSYTTHVPRHRPQRTTSTVDRQTAVSSSQRHVRPRAPESHQSHQGREQAQLYPQASTLEARDVQALKQVVCGEEEREAGPRVPVQRRRFV